jgi:hypothetical protein
MAAIGAAPQYNFFQERMSFSRLLFTGNERKQITWENFKAADRDAGFMACWARRALRVVVVAMCSIHIFLVDLGLVAWNKWRAPGFKRQWEAQGCLSWDDLKWYRGAAGEPLSSDKILELTRTYWFYSPKAGEVELLFGTLPNLRKLALGSTVSEVNLELITKLGEKYPGVQEIVLELSRGENINSQLPAIALAFPNLRKLDLPFSLKTDALSESDAGLIMLGNQCPNLERISCQHVTINQAVVTLAEKLRNLKHLDVGHCDLSDAGLEALGKHSPLLEWLNVKVSGAKITDAGLRALGGSANIFAELRGCRSLKYLNLTSQFRTTNDGVQHILSQCQELENLVLDNTRCERNVILDIRFQCPNLQTLNLENVPGNVTPDGIRNFARMCPRLTRLIFTRASTPLTAAELAQLGAEFPNLVVELK